MSERERIDTALASLRVATERGIDGVAPSRDAVLGAHLPPPVDLPPDEQERLAARVAELEPWTQGPFSLANDLVAGEEGADDRRWTELAPEVPEDLTGRRVLDVGCLAGYDSFVFARRGAAQVLGCEWSDAIEQARLLEEIYGAGVTFEPIGWEELDLERHGTFDIVHCNGILQRVASPMKLLGQLRRMTASDGVLLLGCEVLDSPELSRYARFAPGGSPVWVPGRLTLRWMVEMSGFDAQGWLTEGFGRKSEPPTVRAYLRALRTDRLPEQGL